MSYVPGEYPPFTPAEIAAQGTYGAVLEDGRVWWQLKLDPQRAIVSVTYRNESEQTLWGTVVIPGGQRFTASRNPRSGIFTFPVPLQFAGVKAADCAFAVWTE